MASNCSMGTSRIRPKCGIQRLCLSARYWRNSSGSISTERRPRRTPKRRNRPTVRRASDLGNFPIGLSILCRLDAVKRPRVEGGPNGDVDQPDAPGPEFYLRRKRFSVNCIFPMATVSTYLPTEVTVDLEYPQREAAFFYGLFLRGHSADKLRQDIEVPPAVLAKCHRQPEREPRLRDVFSAMLEYRRHVLAIFDTLVGSEIQNHRVQ